MPFTFVAEPRVWWPVSVRIPADGGKVDTQAFEARFKIVPATRFNALMQSGPAELLAEVVEGWRGVSDQDGTPIAFDPGTRAMLLDVPFVAAALSEAYAEAMLTGARKN